MDAIIVSDSGLVRETTSVWK